MDRKILTAPFPAELVRTRPGKNGMQLSYVETWAYIERLNNGCESWDFIVESHQVIEGEVVVLGKLVADGVTKTAFGGSSVTIDREGRTVSLADDLKAAASDALKKCASLLGVGLELYSGKSGAAQPPVRSPQRAAEAESSRARPAHFGSATVRQLAAINAAARRCQLDQRKLAEFVSREAGKGDVSLLTKDEASLLIDRLNTMQRPSNGASH